MDSIEVSARNANSAIQQALAQLGISEEQAEIVVINEGSRGILGIGAEDARVRVTRRAAPARTPAPQPAAAVRPAPAPRPAPVAAPVTPPAPLVEATAPAPYPVPGQPTAAAPSGMTVGEVAQIAQQVVLELLGAMGITARVILRNVASRASQPLDGDNPIVLDIIGDDLGILIGRRGETLGALQLVTNIIVGRRTREWARIVVDVEGYRLRREDALRSLATRMAERVRYSRTPFTMEAMPPNERRIIHLTLQDSPYVATESHGEGEDRRVTISPRK
ncbi:MAG: RNA-binding cell elongation regulator Jag/EloR [Chloroflexota bacterium]|nr:RNA-binding cell elongation regulator Jag/EloR [Chloroflexota bacterium]